MNKVLSTFFILISGMLLSQENFRADLKFGLFDAGLNFVEYKDFCKTYKIFNDSLKSEMTPCNNSNIQKKDFFNKKKKQYVCTGTIIYNDPIRFFIKGTDTMMLVLNTKGGGRAVVFEIDSLQVMPGKFTINEEHVGHIDFKAAEVDYYNWVLKKFKSLGELTSNYEGSVYFMELNRLRARYRIPGDDYKEKTLADLNKPKPLKRK